MWHFRKMRPADIASDPDFAKALFTGDAAKSLVREAIQNSLDARVSEKTLVVVRFSIRTGPLAARSIDAAPYFAGLWEHVGSETSGLERAPVSRDPIPFLVVEDFGTRGLTGDPQGWNPFASGKNAFFLFFRALGRSGKKEEERGRWGVGKFVFPLASQAHCLLGYTIPSDTNEPLLMGRAVLKMHQVRNAAYHPDGHWGRRAQEDSLVVPERDSDILKDFRALFCLKRSGEPGLSVVVPWLSVDLNGESLTKAVVGEYFLPILRSELRVEIDDNGTVKVIDAGSIEGFLSTISSNELRARVNLAVEAATWPNHEIFVLPTVSATGETDWNAMISEEMKTNLLNALDADRPIAMRVPIQVRPKNGPPVVTSFDVFLQRAVGIGRSRPLIVREGITISEDRTSALQDHAALIIVDRGPLATLIGDSETPAHTELQPQLIANKYTLAGKIIKIVRTSAAELLRSLEAATDDDNFSLLSEFFPLVQASDAKGKKKAQVPGVEPVGPVVPVIPQSPARYRITRIGGGFRVKGADDGELPTALRIRFAYDVRRGNPFKRFNPLDFSLLRRGLSLKTDGVTVVDKTENSIECQPTNTGFSVEVTGFDTLRDLVVRVDASGPEAE